MPPADVIFVTANVSSPPEGRGANRRLILAALQCCEESVAALRSPLLGTLGRSRCPFLRLPILVRRCANSRRCARAASSKERGHVRKLRACHDDLGHGSEK